ncbi:MAG TPA: pyruvate kinase alpha/beta domain-containing protein [Methanospirillum sp.]|uniref:pyruvate kinase alpha/beta domain-containing protein n=1 Tax=Methanospirillum sp. TaxID=45200 RepID=UPI002B941417|nr:pyruvate kinase alpha/beta domain-containing protein [Methanospirillum sp.]HWQ63214.1 pyruvate kinase alpha/beta domain-containing protein [Methanospirillum sp.]
MGYSTKKIWYFDKPGSGNTQDALRIATERAKELGIRSLIVPSTSGQTAKTASDTLQGTEISLIVVSHVVGFSSPGVWEFDNKIADELREQGVKIITGTHVLSGLERAFSSSPKIGGGSRSEAVAEALRRIIAIGLKVAVECTLIAADQGVIPVTEEVIALGGTASGVDTVCVIRPSHTSRFFDLQVREIVAMPRER